MLFATTPTDYNYDSKIITVISNMLMLLFPSIKLEEHITVHKHDRKIPKEKITNKTKQSKTIGAQRETVVLAITAASLASVTLPQTNGRLHKHFYTSLIPFASMLCPTMASLSVRLDPLSDWIQNQCSSWSGHCNGHTRTLTVEF